MRIETSGSEAEPPEDLALPVTFPASWPASTLSASVCPAFLDNGHGTTTEAVMVDSEGGRDSGGGKSSTCGLDNPMAWLFVDVALVRCHQEGARHLTMI